MRASVASAAGSMAMAKPGGVRTVEAAVDTLSKEVLLLVLQCTAEVWEAFLLVPQCKAEVRVHAAGGRDSHSTEVQVEAVELLLVGDNLDT